MVSGSWTVGYISFLEMPVSGFMNQKLGVRAQAQDHELA